MSLRRVVLRVAELAEFAESCVSCLRVALELLPAIICRLQHFIPHSRLFTPACTASTTSALSCFTPAPSLAAVIRSRKPFIKTFFCSREIYDTDHDSSNSAKSTGSGRRVEVHVVRFPHVRAFATLRAFRAKMHLASSMFMSLLMNMMRVF